jgi:hypothetical protein
MLGNSNTTVSLKMTMNSAAGEIIEANETQKRKSGFGDRLIGTFEGVSNVVFPLSGAPG